MYMNGIPWVYIWFKRVVESQAKIWEVIIHQTCNLGGFQVNHSPFLILLDFIELKKPTFTHTHSKLFWTKNYLTTDSPGIISRF